MYTPFPFHKISLRTSHFYLTRYYFIQSKREIILSKSIGITIRDQIVHRPFYFSCFELRIVNEFKKITSDLDVARSNMLHYYDFVRYVENMSLL